MNRLSNKVAVVTGSASGIGRSTARLFAREGAKVAVVDIDSRRTEEVAREIIQEGGQALAVPCNVSDEGEVALAVASIISNFGRIDILFSNAGILHVKELEDTTVEEWDRVMAINAKGVFLWAKHVVPIMKKNGGGSIINAGSSAALTGNLTMTAYTASKGAVVALTRAMALDLAKFNIRVNATCPGAIFTPMLQLEGLWV